MGYRSEGRFGGKKFERVFKRWVGIGLVKMRWKSFLVKLNNN